MLRQEYGVGSRIALGAVHHIMTVTPLGTLLLVSDELLAVDE